MSKGKYALGQRCNLYGVNDRRILFLEMATLGYFNAMALHIWSLFLPYFVLFSCSPTSFLIITYFPMLCTYRKREYHSEDCIWSLLWSYSSFFFLYLEFQRMHFKKCYLSEFSMVHVRTQSWCLGIEFCH